MKHPNISLFIVFYFLFFKRKIWQRKKRFFQDLSPLKWMDILFEFFKKNLLWNDEYVFIPFNNVLLYMKW
jgi:hypothetical protein